MEVADTNLNQLICEEDHDPQLPSCDIALDTCQYALHYDEAGAVAALKHSIVWFKDWLNSSPGISDMRAQLTTDRLYLRTIYNTRQKKRAAVDFRHRESNSDFFWRRDGS